MSARHHLRARQQRRRRRLDREMTICTLISFLLVTVGLLVALLLCSRFWPVSQYPAETWTPRLSTVSAEPEEPAGCSNAVSSIAITQHRTPTR